VAVVSTEQTYPKWFQDLVQEWRERLIPEWRVVLMPHPLNDDEGKAGQSQANVTYRHLSVWVDMDADNYSATTLEPLKRDMEEVLVHELLHAPIELILDSYRPAVEHMGYDARQLIARTADLAEEHHVEAQARLLVALKYGEKQVRHVRVADPVSGEVEDR
jgi:hypothetical protein